VFAAVGRVRAGPGHHVQSAPPVHPAMSLVNDGFVMTSSVPSVARTVRFDPVVFVPMVTAVPVSAMVESPSPRPGELYHLVCRPCPAAEQCRPTRIPGIVQVRAAG